MFPLKRRKREVILFKSAYLLTHSHIADCSHTTWKMNFIQYVDGTKFPEPYYYTRVEDSLHIKESLTCPFDMIPDGEELARSQSSAEPTHAGLQNCSRAY